MNLLKESYEKALELLRENREIMDKIAEFLIEKETITGKEFMEIFRREKGLPEPEEKKDEKADAESEQNKEDKASTVDVTVTDDTQTAEEQSDAAKESEESVEETTSEQTNEETPKDENVGRFSNGRL